MTIAIEDYDSPLYFAGHWWPYDPVRGLFYAGSHRYWTAGRAWVTLQQLERSLALQDEMEDTLNQIHDSRHYRSTHG